MSDSVKSKLARSIFDQWLEIPRSGEFYKCSKCRCAENLFESLYDVHPDDCAFRQAKCLPSHKNGQQAYLAVDATPKQGGIAFFTGCGECYYHQPDFNQLGISINEAKPTEFEMANLLIALCIFKTEILEHKTVRIIVDNNFLRKRGKMQRHALTEAIAAILEWCDNSGCTINEIFQSNTSEDEPFLKIADRLSRNKDIQQWLEQNEETSSHFVFHTQYYRSTRPTVNKDILEAINEILKEPVKDESRLCLAVAESSSSPHSTSRFQRMLRYFDTIFSN